MIELNYENIIHFCYRGKSPNPMTMQYSEESSPPMQTVLNKVSLVFILKYDIYIKNHVMFIQGYICASPISILKKSCSMSPNILISYD